MRQTISRGRHIGLCVQGKRRHPILNFPDILIIFSFPDRHPDRAYLAFKTLELRAAAEPDDVILMAVRGDDQSQLFPRFLGHVRHGIFNDPNVPFASSSRGDPTVDEHMLRSQLFGWYRQEEEIPKAYPVHADTKLLFVTGFALGSRFLRFFSTRSGYFVQCSFHSPSQTMAKLIWNRSGSLPSSKPIRWLY